MESEPKYQDVSKFLRLDSAKWSIMQQIAGCAMPLLDKSDWIDSSRLFVGFPHKKTKGNQQTTNKEGEKWLLQKEIPKLEIMLVRFHVGFPGCTVDNSKQCVCSFLLISCLVVICGQTNLLTSLALIVWLKFPMIFHLGFFGPYPLASSTNDCEESWFNSLASALKWNMYSLSLFYLGHPPDTTAMSQLALSPKWAASCNSFAPIVAGELPASPVAASKRAFCADWNRTRTALEDWCHDLTLGKALGNPLISCTHPKQKYRSTNWKLGSQDNSLIRVDLSHDLHVASASACVDVYRLLWRYWMVRDLEAIRVSINIHF